MSNETKKKISLAKLGRGKGISLKPSGYLEITMGKNKGRSQHTVIMENEIGRRLYQNEVVHHIDHNRSNNNISNLELMTRKEHCRFHALENYKNRNRNVKGEFV